jgi:fibronectin type 3 domain-containing protein
VKLSWNKTDTADGYRVYLKNSSGNYKILTTTTNTSFTATGLSAGTKYDFAIKAYRKSDGKTLWGESTKKTAETSSGKPSSFSDKESYNSVALSWREVKGADGYKVYVYNSKKKKYTTLKTVSNNKYTAEELKSGTTYKFAVKPYAKKNGKTYYGKPVYLTVTTKLTLPSLTAKITSKGNTLKWSKVNGADGYVIYYSTKKDGSYKKLKATTATSYTHLKTSKSKNYYYKVRAYKTVSGEKIYSSFSTVRKASR